jgi:uncharacterized phage protein (TIGR01671 family)
MREIKFRVFDYKKEKMIDVTQLYLSEEMFSSDDVDFCSIYNYNNKYYSGLMQYTGLKDKNGKKIYEGDIIESSNITGVDEVTEYMGIVMYVEDDGGFYLKVKKIKRKNKIQPMDYYTILKNHENKIIGNIYKTKGVEDDR